MCGIAGYIDFTKTTSKVDLASMIGSLDHRGPDDEGIIEMDADVAKLGLAHKRLSILDLSKAGHQPMQFKNFTIVHNGEIYNYKEIRVELSNKGHKFISNSDTEVILHAFDEWGINSIQRFIGMFAFAIFDQLTNQIYLIRDRAGVKPVYYYFKNNLFLFGSELKGLLNHPEFERIVDHKAVKLYFDYGYIPSPHTIYQDTNKLKPAHYLILDLKEKKVLTFKYWDTARFYSDKSQISYIDAKDELHSIFKSAFNYRLVSDVPVGVFLSGGYDSTLVTSILQKENSNQLKTFTIGFEEGNNEAPAAKKIAKYLETDHTEYICTSKEAQAIIPTLPHYYDEPFADSSAIPTMLVSQIAKQDVTVALSADGGDEIFAGYDSYKLLKDKIDILNCIPNTLKPISSNLFSLSGKLTPSNMPSFKHKLEAIGASINKDKIKQGSNLFQLMRSLPKTYHQNMFSSDFNSVSSEPYYDIASHSFQNEIEYAMSADFNSYLPDDILTKVDRATMSVALEGREPLLDHRIIEFAAKLPLEYKYDGVSSKKIVKDIVHDYLPKELMDRPKTGFSLPIYDWLRGDLAYLLDDFLNEDQLKESGLFNVSFILNQVALFKKNKLHYQPFIWKMLMFQMWYKKWMR